MKVTEPSWLNYCCTGTVSSVHQGPKVHIKVLVWLHMTCCFILTIFSYIHNWFAAFRTVLTRSSTLKGIKGPSGRHKSHMQWIHYVCCFVLRPQHFSSQTCDGSEPMPQRFIVSLPAPHRSPIQLLTCSIVLRGSHWRVIGNSHSATSIAFVPLLRRTDPDVWGRSHVNWCGVLQLHDS